MTHEEREIRQVHSTWINAVNAGELVRLMTLITDDAVFLTPGQDSRRAIQTGARVRRQESVTRPEFRHG